MLNSNLAGLFFAILAIIPVLARTDTTNAQCQSVQFDTPTYTTSGGTQGAGSLVGQDSWTASGNVPSNQMYSIVNTTSFSGTQSVKTTTLGADLREASKLFTGCSTTTNTGLISVRLKFKKGVLNPNLGVIMKPIVADDHPTTSATFGFFQILGNGTMFGRGGAATTTLTDTFDPDNFPGNGFPSNGWHDLEMRLNPSPNTITDPGTNTPIPFGHLLYVINGNKVPAAISGHENPMVYYGGTNTSGKVGRLTFRREVGSGSNGTETAFFDAWEVWPHPRPIAKAQPFTVQLNGAGTATVTGLNIDNGSVGGDPNQTISGRTAFPSNFTCSNLGSNSVTLTVTQSDGQTATAVTTVTVQDTVAPDITSCGNNQSTNANANCQGTVPNFTSAVTATDNCTASGSLTKTQSPTAGTVVGPGVTVVTITVKDALNNQSQCTRNFTVNAPDTDGDGTPDCSDGCPNDPNKTAPGICGCGVADTDTDGDSTPDCNDGCPNDPDKIAPGLCGCGVPDDDSDSDTVPDCLDGCPSDPNKIAPGLCGCGVPENSCASRTITAWRSLRTHAGPPVTELGIVLNAAASGNGSSGPTVDSRGPTISYPGVQKIQVDFDGAVTLANPSNVTVTYRVTTPPSTMGGPISVSPTVAMADSDTMNITFPANTFPNMSCIEITIGAGTLLENLTGDTNCSVRALMADVNGSGTVTTSDQLAVKNQVGQSINVAAKFDLNMSGSTITTTDQAAVKAQVVSPTRTALCP